MDCPPGSPCESKGLEYLFQIPRKNPRIRLPVPGGQKYLQRLGFYRRMGQDDNKIKPNDIKNMSRQVQSKFNDFRQVGLGRNKK
jgi:hypothetical protein